MRLLARSWAGLISGYAVILYLATIVAAMAEAQVNALSFVGALLFIVVGIPVVDSLIGLAMFGRARATGETSSWHGWLVLRRVARLVVSVVAVLIVLNFLGVNLVAAATNSLGGWIARLVFNVGVTMLVAYVLWELAIAAINRKLAEETPPDAARRGRRDEGQPICRPYCRCFAARCRSQSSSSPA